MFEHAPHPPRVYQRRAAAALVERALPEGALLPADVGWGKSMIVIAAAYELAQRGEIDTVFAITPAYARSIWASSDLLIGEFAKYPHPRVPLVSSEYCAAQAVLPRYKTAGALQVVVTNYELVRRDDHLQAVQRWLRDRRALVVCDESWNLFNPRAAQTQAVTDLCEFASRVVMLNGTPGKPEQVYSQITAMNRRAYPVRNFHHWKARYAISGGFQGKAIVGYRDDTAAERVAIERRYVVAPEPTDAIDVPELMPPILIEAQLTARTWDLYRQMRDEFVAWLDADHASVAVQAGVKFLRLQQILAGFIGGVEEAHDETGETVHVVREVGDEKLRAALAWLDGQERQKAIVWGRFRLELARVAETLRGRGETVHMLVGKRPDVSAKQHDADRLELKRLFASGSSDRVKRWIVGHPAAGGAGLDFSGADLVIYLTNAQSLRVRKQSLGRVHRPGQRTRVRLVDVVAIGPQGQKTVDHAVIKALRNEEDITTWTAAQWRAAVAGDDVAPTVWSTP